MKILIKDFIIELLKYWEIMKPYNWQITLGIILLIFSAIVYLLHYIIFRDPYHIFIYLIGDIAFVFIEVLLVTLVIHSLLTMKEKKKRLEKLNMLIGTFFSEVGTKLLVYFSDSNPNLKKIKKDLIIEADWSEKEFQEVSKKLRKYLYGIDVKQINISVFRNFLIEKNDFLVRLLENPNLLEHESFTELLRAVFHLDEELRSRKNIEKLPENDLKHISGDIKRAYVLLVHQWLMYMRYLKDNYPYLFSLAMRLNPFDETATPELKYF